MKFLKMKYLVILLLIMTSFTFIQAQENSYSINWSAPIEYGLEGKTNLKTLNFDEAQYDFGSSNLPFLVIVKKNATISAVALENVVVEKVPNEELQLIDLAEIGSEFTVKVDNPVVKRVVSTWIKISPLRKNSLGEVERLVSFELNPSSERKSRINREKSLTFAGQSALSSGDWFKIAVVNDGVYKLTYTFLKSLGVDVDNIDPRNFKLYGYGGGMLPEANSEYRPDDMMENAIIVKGEADGVFNKNDYVLFYGEDQVEWRYDSSRALFRHQINLYDDTTFYFIRTDGLAGKRIQLSPQYTATTADVGSYDLYAHYERDITNLLKSGSVWIGELFDNANTFNISFNTSDLVTTEQGKIEINVFARSGVTSSFDLGVNGQNFVTSLGSVNLNRYEFRFAQSSRSFFDFTPNAGLLNFQLTYSKPRTVSKGWLNMLAINVRRNLVLNAPQMGFRDVRSVSSGDFARFKVLTNNMNTRVFDLTDRYNIAEMPLQKNTSSVSFVGDVSTLREYVAFNEVDTISIYKKGRVSNQNLHSLPQADMFIITHPRFMSAANNLANFHNAEGLSVNVVTPQAIYNEFSSGAQDLIAIRTFLKMFYDRSVSQGTPPQYVVMMGDASFDYKDRIAGNTNFVPAFQSKNSLDPVNSHVSDDYFGLLDDSEGEWVVNGPDRMDIAIGRFPVQTLAEADGIVNKIKAYYSPSALRDWRNKMVFVGDDEDGVIHMSQSDDLAEIVETNQKDFNTEKIFLDAYQQQSTASGARYPDVTVALNEAVEGGSLLINYTGHGGETGWTAERVLGVFDITNWQNLNNMPVFMTATCEFSRFDDPLRTSGGELALLNPNGGGIGLMTTTRLVFSSPNYLMNRTLFNEMFKRKANGETKRLGDIFLEVKNLNAYSSNSRNFSLLGDPALKLALPYHDVVTTTINGTPVSLADTLSALSTVTITGEVRDVAGNRLNGFNGIVYPTIFDKVEDKKTLNNDGAGVFKYQTRERRIFKGKATVTNGTFTFRFVVPKDISYSYGSGKISYYAQNQVEDANGFEDQFIIGGSNPSFVNDDAGPQMDLFMNDLSFVYGGITDKDPILLVNLADDQGINTVGSGIGHDLVAILDEQTDKAFILNDYYEASIDDYTKGTVRFPFSDLSPGKHTLRVKAWDVANNSAERTIEFNVMEEKDVEIENLVNYPNPFTTNTEFIFQHNQAGVPLDIKLEIFTVSGKLVKSIDQMVVNEGFVSRDIKWDGRDDFGDRIAKGVYVYKLKVRSGNGSTSEKIEKLVIL